MTRRAIIWLIITLLLILTGAAAAYYFYYLPTQKQPPADEGPQTTSYDGQYVTGELPQGWTIVEYQNGAGTTMLTTGPTYTGLTALEVKNPAGTVIFAIHGVYGIGGTDVCENYFKFADDSSAYYDMIISGNVAASSPVPVIVDLSTSSYSSINLFTTRIRRVVTTLYWDNEPSATFFEAACGIQEDVLNFAVAPRFTIAGAGIPQTSTGSYHFVLEQSASAQDLETLDTILNSLSAQ